MMQNAQPPLRSNDLLCRSCMKNALTRDGFYPKTVIPFQPRFGINMFADSFDSRLLRFSLRLEVKRQVIAAAVGKLAGEEISQAFRHHVCGEEINLRFAICNGEVNATHKAAVGRNGIVPR